MNYLDTVRTHNAPLPAGGTRPSRAPLRMTPRMMSCHIGQPAEVTAAPIAGFASTRSIASAGEGLHGSSRSGIDAASTDRFRRVAFDGGETDVSLGNNRLARFMTSVESVTNAITLPAPQPEPDPEPPIEPGQPLTQVIERRRVPAATCGVSTGNPSPECGTATHRSAQKLRRVDVPGRPFAEPRSRPQIRRRPGGPTAQHAGVIFMPRWGQ